MTLKRNRKSTFAIRESKKKISSHLFPFPIPLYFKHSCFPAAFPFSCVYPKDFSGFLTPEQKKKKKTNEIIAKYIGFWQATVTR